MAYCTVDEVRRRCSAVSSSDVPDATVEIYILEAQDEIDTQLSTEYTVPFTSVPTMISRMCADLAAYFLMKDYPDKVFHDDKAEIREDYRKALDSLKNGLLDLTGVTRLSTSEAGTHVVFTTSHCSRWGDDRTVNFRDL